MQMNKLYKSIIAAALLIMGVGSTNAQTRCTVGDKTHYRTYEVSDNMVVRKINDNQVVATPKLEKNIVMTEGKGTGVLKINALGDYSMIAIANEDDYFNFAFPGMDFCEEVSEGTYYVIMDGACEDGMPGWCVYDVAVSSETDTTTLNIAMKDAKNTIFIGGKDENGVGFADLPIDTFTYDINNFFIVGDGLFSASLGVSSDVYFPMSMYKFSDLKDYCKIFTSVTFTTQEQKFYVVKYPDIREMTGDVTLENDPSDFVKHEEYFNLNNQDSTSYYGICYATYSGESWGRHGGFSSWCVYDQTKPYTIVTNAVDDGSPLTYDQAKIRVLPTVYNSYDLYSWAWPPYEDVMVPFGIGLDSDGKFFYEPYGNFYSTGYDVASYPDFLATTPARQYLDETMYYGSRTPLLYHNSYNHNATTNPEGEVNFIQSQTSYLGENGLQRVGDQWQPIIVTVNGNEMWNDSLFNFNQYRFELQEAGEIEMNIKNMNIKNDSVAKINKTKIEFDLNREDAMPPTFTMLQVINQTGKEGIVITNLDYSEINVAAGDWMMYSDPETWAFYPIYVEGAEVELYYKTAKDEEFLTLEFTEVEDMFHINYGKYFNVQLSQLEGVNNQWVSMKLVVTDAAGNSQEQILENLFYVDIAYSVNEISANSLSHSVYPNPFSGNVTINAVEPVNGVATFTIYNTIGEMVYSSTMNCNETTEFRWNAADNANGVYLYQISTEKGMIQGRIVKE